MRDKTSTFTMRTELKMLVVAAFIIFCSVCTAAIAANTGGRWQIGAPITTYWAGPILNEATAKQIVDGGFNLVWLCPEEQLDIVSKYGMRTLLLAPVLRGDAFYGNQMNDKVQIAEIDALIERVKRHPAMYAYYICDEPNASQFPALGKLVAHLRERDPAHVAYINLLPSYGFLGTKSEVEAAYRKYLRPFIEQVKPDILSYDHYHFTANGKDDDQYFLNLGMIRQAALGAGIPFMNIGQGCTFDPRMRAPNGDEMRWFNYTSLAYGAQGLSYFVYYYADYYKSATKRGVDPGGMMRPDGSTTAQYAAAKELNPQFIAIASQLQPLRSLGAYHVGILPWGAVALPENAPFYLDFSGNGMSKMPAEGMLLGYFGKAGKNTKPTHVLVVNLSYKNAVTTTVVGPGPLYLFDAVTHKWTRGATDSRVTVTLPPGGGKLIRVQ